eukprot:7669155-Alexandrium_andersonii.AAC.1
MEPRSTNKGRSEPFRTDRCDSCENDALISQRLRCASFCTSRTATPVDNSRNNLICRLWSSAGLI